MKILNAVSLNMLPSLVEGQMFWKKISLEEARDLAWQASNPDLFGKLESCVGHADTAKVFSTLLGVDVPENRVTVTLGEEFSLVGQYIGPRLEVGATALPAGAKVDWFLVSVGPVRDAARLNEEQKAEVAKMQAEINRLRALLPEKPDNHVYGEEWLSRREGG
jgi:hypothetical protein